MLLGVVLHGLLWFVPDAWPIQEPWAYSRPIETNVYAYLLSAIHGFRMPVFFLLSGFFTALLWEQRGLRSLIAHRFKRIAIPLVLGALTIVPINVWLMDPDGFNLPRWPLSWLESLHHLWFLWVLLILAAAFIMAARSGLRFGHPLWWLAVPGALIPQLLMVEPIFGPDTSDGIIPDPGVLLYYAMFFSFGAFFWTLRMTIRRWWAALLPLALGPVFMPGLVVLFEVPGTVGHVTASALQVAYAWLMAFGMIGLFRWIASRERAWVRYASDASYWIYLWHLPLVLAGQALMVDWDTNPHLKFLLICTSVTGVLLVVYQLGVRYTPVGSLLNGPRRRSRPASIAA